MQIDAFLRNLVVNPYFGLASFLIGIISLLYAFRIAKRDKKIIHLYYNLVSTNIIANSKELFEKLSIIYNGNTVDNFSVAKIKIKNIGTTVIKSLDIAQSDPIKIYIAPSGGDAKILDFSVLRTKNPNNNFTISRVENNSFNIAFGFMEPKDSITLQILHTGQDSSCIAVSGTVIGSNAPFTQQEDDIFPNLTRIEMSMVKLFTTPGKVTLPVPLMIVFVFGGFALLLYQLSSYVLSVICLLPAIYFTYQIIITIFEKPDPEEDLELREHLMSVVERALDKASKQAK